MRKLALSMLVATLFCVGPVLADGSMIIAEGFSAPNTYSGVMPDWFDDWCNDVSFGGPCFGTVALEVTDVRKGKRLGTIYAWGKEFTGAPDGTLQFKEFILYDLKDGQLFTLSTEGGHPGGNFGDPVLIPPKAGDAVLLGGAEGEVVGGTGRYRRAGGAYSTRLKVEVDYASGFFIYYDELYIRFRDVVINPGRND